jgi:glycosyltransferase involved in cell wall biosynthesis
MNLYGSAKLTQVIYGTPEVSEIFTNKQSDYLRNKFKIPNESKIYVLAGYIDEGRHFDLILDVFKETPKSHLVFIGFKNKDYLNSMSLEHHNIHYHDFVAQSELTFILNSADIGICLIENTSLSYYLSIPQKFWEYYFAGLEVVCSNFPEMSRMTKYLKRGVTINNTFQDLKNLVDNYQGSELMRYSVDLYSFQWGNQTKKIIEVYEKVMELNQ